MVDRFELKDFQPQMDAQLSADSPDFDSLMASIDRYVGELQRNLTLPGGMSLDEYLAQQGLTTIADLRKLVAKKTGRLLELVEMVDPDDEWDTVLRDLGVPVASSKGLLAPNPDGGGPLPMAMKDAGDGSFKEAYQQGELLQLVLGALVEVGVDFSSIAVEIEPDPDNQLRRKPYFLLKLAELNKSILLNPQSGETTFVIDGAEHDFWPVDKDKLVQDLGAIRVTYSDARPESWQKRLQRLVVPELYEAIDLATVGGVIDHADGPRVDLREYGLANGLGPKTLREFVTSEGGIEPVGTVKATRGARVREVSLYKLTDIEHLIPKEISAKGIVSLKIDGVDTECVLPSVYTKGNVHSKTLAARIGKSGVKPVEYQEKVRYHGKKTYVKKGVLYRRSDIDRLMTIKPDEDGYYPVKLEEGVRRAVNAADYKDDLWAYVKTMNYLRAHLTPVEGYYFGRKGAFYWVDEVEALMAARLIIDDRGYFEALIPGDAEDQKTGLVAVSAYGHYHGINLTTFRKQAERQGVYPVKLNEEVYTPNGDLVDTFYRLEEAEAVRANVAVDKQVVDDVNGVILLEKDGETRHYVTLVKYADRVHDTGPSKAYELMAAGDAVNYAGSFELWDSTKANRIKHLYLREDADRILGSNKS